MIGVTGTNGKTSTTHLLRSIFEESERGKVGLIGTIGQGSGDELHPLLHTTPEPITLHRILKDMRDQGCIGVVMEVSSHAVRQQRVWDIDFEIGMLINVTRDHLDYHPTFEDYIAAKTEFCYSLVSEYRRKADGVLVYSLDDRISKGVGDAFTGRKVSTSMLEPADVYATGVDASLRGTRFVLHREGTKGIEIAMKLLGSFSVANALFAAAGATLCGISLGEIKAGIEAVANIPGRFEAFGGDSKPFVIVDYSHTPDSLDRTLSFCLDLKPRRLITVFGCGGDRDRGKRPLMGKIAQRHSDICYVTSDNPRTEDPREIIEEILVGMDEAAEGLFIEVDRRRAIREAVSSASSGDLVAICGKGHEDYQIIGTTRHHFDDREEAEGALAKWSER
jgi:UDP-N-acetylmuramoyl-L-alanyl-D-glutamate--2,6-diaminopimelate ligase